MGLRPLDKNFLFQFFNETREGRFIDRTKTGIILSHNDIELQSKYARWVKVLAVGDKVSSFVPGDIVLVDYGKWTVGIEHEGQKLWKSDEDQVSVIGEDESVTYTM